MPKPDPDLMERMDGLLNTVPAKRRSMFGTVSWFANSNEQMFTGVWGDRVNARVGEDAVAELVGAGEADPFEPMPGRPMKEYVLLPVESVSEDADLQTWVERALAFAEGLPPKRR